MPEIKVGDYLFRRLRQLGIKSVFGVPGDYELALLDLIPDNDLEWKGNPNELVAAYAADGYARVNGAGAFVTTFGPGELSAYCGVGGQYAEFVPVAHIVGYPSSIAQTAGAILHHTLGDGKFDMYHEMSKHISTATTVLNDAKFATEEIDRVLTAMIYESRPVYIGVPTDTAYALVSDEGLSTPILQHLPKDDASVVKQLVSKVRTLLEQASNPVVIVDGGAARSASLDETHALVSATGIPIFTTAMSKGSINETINEFGGTYAGGASHSAIKDVVETSDALLWIGRYPGDFNTGEFTVSVHEDKVVDLQRFTTTIGGEKIRVGMKNLLQALIADVKEKSFAPKAQKLAVTWNPYPADNPPIQGKLTQDFLWPTLGKFFSSKDLIIAETGTSAFGVIDSKLPADVHMWNQTIFGSIGYATGASVGAFTAMQEEGIKERFKRGILITGEGSMHLTVQAIADLLRYGLKPTIFVLNNSGYTVERLIHGPTAPYNDVAIWDYGTLAQTFGPAFPSKYYGPIKTAQEFVELVNNPELAKGDCFNLVELVLDPLDAPLFIRMAGPAVDEFNKKKAGGVPGA